MNPLNQYAISKLQIDYTVLDNIDKFPLIQGFRYFNVYGSGEENKGDQASPVSKFTKQIKETGKLKLFEGSDKFFRDFICVDDLVNVVLNNENPSGIYDLGTSNPVSFQHVAECVARKYNGEIEYHLARWSSKPPMSLPSCTTAVFLSVSTVISATAPVNRACSGVVPFLNCT